MRKYILELLICSLAILIGCEKDGYIIEPTVRTTKGSTFLIFKEPGTTRKEVYDHGYWREGRRSEFYEKLEFIQIKKGAKNLCLSNMDGNIDDVTDEKAIVYLEYNGVYYLYNSYHRIGNTYYLFYETKEKKYKRKIIFL
jgi:hypothetical protein